MFLLVRAYLKKSCVQSCVRGCTQDFFVIVFTHNLIRDFRH